MNIVVISHQGETFSDGIITTIIGCQVSTKNKSRCVDEFIYLIGQVVASRVRLTSILLQWQQILSLKQ